MARSVGCSVTLIKNVILIRKHGLNDRLMAGEPVNVLLKEIRLAADSDTKCQNQLRPVEDQLPILSRRSSG